MPLEHHYKERVVELCNRLHNSIIDRINNGVATRDDMSHICTILTNTFKDLIVAEHTLNVYYKNEFLGYLIIGDKIKIKKNVCSPVSDARMQPITATMFIYFQKLIHQVAEHSDDQINKLEKALMEFS